jgi:ankyrin repeat protein
MKDQFFAAIKQGDVRTVQSLLSKDKALVIATDEKGRTGLHIAAFLGSEALVNLLLDNGAPLEAKESKANATPLHMAVQRKQIATISLLLKRKAQVNATMEGNYTPLHLAASVGDDEIVAIVLQYKALLEARTDKQCTALHLAAQNGHAKAVEHLVKAKADLEARQKFNWTPLHFAAQNGRDGVIKLLVGSGANVNAIADNEVIPLHLAAQNGQTASAEILLDAGAAIDAKDKEGRWTPVCMAAKAGHVTTVNLLLDRGASTQTVTKGSNTVLHLAALHNQPTVVGPILLRDPTLRDQKNSEFKSALQLAKEKGHQAIVQILEASQVLQDNSKLYRDQFEKEFKLAMSRYQNDDGVTAQLQAALGQKFNQAMENLLRGPNFQSEIKRLEEEVIEQIRQRQGRIASQLMHVQTKLKNQHDPMFKQYQSQQQLLKEQQALQQPEAVWSFYNTVEKKLGAYFVAVINLTSGMVKREDTTAEKVVNTASNVANNVSSFIPVVGNFIGLITMAVGYAHGMYQDKKQEKKQENASKTVLGLNDALSLAELVARRLTQSFKDVLNSNVSAKEAVNAAEKAVAIICKCIEKGELNPYKTLDEKVSYLVQQVRANAQQAGYVFQKNLGAVNSTIAQTTYASTSTAFLNPANQGGAPTPMVKVVQEMGKEVNDLKAQMRNMKGEKAGTQSVVGCSLYNDTTWTEALDNFNHQMSAVRTDNNLRFSKAEEDKALLINSSTNSAADNRMLKMLGATLQAQFPSDIVNCKIMGNTLKIDFKLSQGIEELLGFLQQANFVLIDIKAEAARYPVFNRGAPSKYATTLPPGQSQSDAYATNSQWISIEEANRDIAAKQKQEMNANYDDVIPSASQSKLSNAKSKEAIYSMPGSIPEDPYAQSQWISLEDTNRDLAGKAKQDMHQNYGDVSVLPPLNKIASSHYRGFPQQLAVPTSSYSTASSSELTRDTAQRKSGEKPRTPEIPRKQPSSHYDDTAPPQLPGNPQVKK